MDSNRPLPAPNADNSNLLTSRTHAKSEEPRRAEHLQTFPDSPERAATRRVGYGLPCAKCKAYYAADAAVCPYCSYTDRVAPIAGQVPQPATQLKQDLENLRAEIAQALGQGSGQESQDPQLEEEREKFLREYKAQLYANHTQIRPATAFRCTLEKNHRQGSEPAAICKSCYNDAAERMEHLEAALCMDVREAAQLIYDAVWSDPSPADPSRTYQNAAMAVLTELRRRAGIQLAFAAVAPYAH